MAKSASRRTRKSPPKRARKAWSAARDALRIVPLHYPKPVYSVEQLANLQRAGASQDLYDGQLRAVPADAMLSYRGGPLITRAQVYSVYWGASWAGSDSARALIAGLDRFFSDILPGPLMDQLAEYNVGSKRIGHGKFLGSSVRTESAPQGSVTDASVRSQLKQWIRGKALPQTSANTLYFIFLEPGVVSIMGGSRSCQNYCGYHNAAGKVYYALMPYPSCAGCLGGMNVLDALTATSSHELCEAITDPVPGKGWYDDRYGEIGDICAWQFKKLGAHTVQLEWSNAQRRCI